MKPNCKLNHFQQLLFHTFPPPLLSYFDGRAPLLSARVTLVPSRGGAGVVCYVEKVRKFYYISKLTVHKKLSFGPPLNFQEHFFPSGSFLLSGAPFSLSVQRLEVFSKNITFNKNVPKIMGRD